jgi:hypothetical protein
LEAMAMYVEQVKNGIEELSAKGVQKMAAQMN